MNSTHAFFQKTVPAKGMYFLAEPYRKRDGADSFRHFPYDTLAQMAEAVEQFNDQGRTIYHACAAFKMAIHKTTDGGFPYVAGRHARNALGALALWDDIDVGKTTVPSYDSQRAACRGLLDACRKVEIPLPMIVSSGVGLHVYWPLLEAIDPATWATLARLKTKCLAHAGLRIDPSRTADIASILRPVGAKRLVGGNTRIVRVLADAARVDFQQLHNAFNRYASAHALLTVSVPARKIHDRAFAALDHRKITSALSVIDPNEYGAWVKVCACLVTLRDQLGEDARCLWLTFSDAASDGAKQKNGYASTDPEIMFDRMTPSMGADAAIGALMALAKETATGIATREIQTRCLTERGSNAIRHLVRFHPRDWETIQNTFKRSA
ncbi:MAG: hypothetical protein ACM3SV_03610 [Betaproteobacteria bacterium]